MTFDRVKYFGKVLVYFERETVPEAVAPRRRVIYELAERSSSHPLFQDRRIRPMSTHTNDVSWINRGRVEVFGLGLALAIWDNEGGAGPSGAQESSSLGEISSDPSASANAELVQLHARVIALENLLIALLADGPDLHSGRIREMASFIVPRPGFTQHRLTVHAAHHMVDLINRAAHFRLSVNA